MKDFIISKCSNCPIKKDCKHFKNVYKKYSQDAEREVLNEYGFYNVKFLEINLNPVKKDEINIKIKRVLKEKLNNNTNTCKIEKSIITNVFKDLDDVYNLSKNKQLYHLAQQIVMLELYNFRLAINHKHYGIINEAEKSKKLYLTPGLHYSIDISEKISNIIEKMNKIAFGEKQVVENINTIKINDIISHIDDKDIIEYKDVKEIE